VSVTQKKIPFILIDDNPLDLKINERILLHGQVASSVMQFTRALLALRYIKEAPKPADITVILLDIQMPEMDGFGFLAAFNALDENIRSGYTIFMLSSTLDEFDLRRVWLNPDAVAFLSKPLDFKALTKQLAKL